MTYDGCGVGGCPEETERYGDLCADCQRGCAENSDDDLQRVGLYMVDDYARIDWAEWDAMHRGSECLLCPPLRDVSRMVRDAVAQEGYEVRTNPNSGQWELIWRGDYAPTDYRRELWGDSLRAIERSGGEA